MNKNDRASKWLLVGFLILTVLSIAATYYQSIILRDFEIIDDLEEELMEEEE